MLTLSRDVSVYCGVCGISSSGFFDTAICLCVITSEEEVSAFCERLVWFVKGPSGSGESDTCMPSSSTFGSFPSSSDMTHMRVDFAWRQIIVLGFEFCKAMFT